MNYLILGNSAAAVSAVDAIRSIDVENPITMVSPESGCAYGTPLISYVLEGKTDEGHAIIRDTAWYEKNAITCLFGPGKEAVSLNTNDKTVTLADNTQLTYDKLLVACGSLPNQPSVEGLPDHAPNSFTFNTMEDMRAIQSYLESRKARQDQQPLHAVVAGSGLIGMKAAEGICKHVDHTYVVGHAPRVLRKLLDDHAEHFLDPILAKHQIESIPCSVIASVSTNAENEVVSVTLDNGTILPCDLLITATGVHPNVDMLEQAGAHIERGAVCDSFMQTSLPDVYAAGDVANTPQAFLNQTAPLALWPTASEQGRIAGLAMAGKQDTTFEGAFGRNAVGFFGEINILGCGVIDPSINLEDTHTVVFEDNDSYAKFNIKDDQLIGYLLINRPDQAGIYTTIINKRIPLSTLPEDILQRTPCLHDLPEPIRSQMLLRGYPQTQGAPNRSTSKNRSANDQLEKRTA